MVEEVQQELTADYVMKKMEAVMHRLDTLTNQGKARDAAVAKHPAELEDMREQCAMVMARSKRDRDLDPAKQGTARQLDVLESAQAHLKKAKRAFSAIRLPAPVTHRVGNVIEPVSLEVADIMDFDEVKEAMEALDKGMTVLRNRESTLLVIFNSDNNKQGYAAIEASDLGEGAGSLSHLEPARKKIIQDIIAVGNLKYEKVKKEERKDKEEKTTKNKSKGQ